MHMTKNSFSISKRLSLGFSAVLLLLMLTAGYGITQIIGLGKTFESFGTRSGEAVAASDLGQDLMSLQASIVRLAALNTHANQVEVQTNYARFRTNVERNADKSGIVALSRATREMEELVSGPESLAAIQNQVDAARANVSQAASQMSETVASMTRRVDQIGDVPAVAVVQDRVLKARMLIRSYQFTGSADEIGDALAALRDAERKFDQFDRMDSALAQNPLIQEGRKDLAIMFEGLYKIRSAIILREKSTARAMELGTQVAEALETGRTRTLNAMTATGAETKNVVDNAFWRSLTLAGTTVIIGVALAILIARSISTPIRKMTTAMRKLSEGHLETVVPGTGRRDEIGAMAVAMQFFKDAAIERQLIEATAAAQRQADADARHRIEAAAAEQAIAGERSFVIAKFGAGIRRLANGDFSLRMEEEMPGEYERLRHDFNEAVGQLSETIRAVSESANAIDWGSREISQGSDDLSKRTEQQAASLEQTAAALDELTANVSHSSKRADEARGVSQLANLHAAESARVVANTVDAMGKIAQSSVQISNIIGVIDEIAFQTNLLALNAGVEAARAGDAGKGFAVVAQEVRELAQRSATAAKEIKDLIRNSNNDVESGVELVRQTGEVLRTIEEQIVTVNQHMSAIATSAKEQSVGLAEINGAVNQMDHVTQQNAAMVEQTNAASATLAVEASRLRSLVAGFTFYDDHKPAVRRVA